MEDLIIIPIGDVDFDNLTEEQEQELITFLLGCFVKMYEEDKAKRAI